jgi:hypothetical protein
MKGAVMRLPPRALRHVMTHRWAFSAVAVTVLITSAFTAAAAAFLSTVTSIAVRSELARNPGSQIVVAAPVPGDQVARATRVVSAAVRGPGGLGAPPQLRTQIVVSLQSGIMRLAGADGRSTKLETQLISLPALASHISVVAGHCDTAPAGPEANGGPGGKRGPGGQITACLPQTAARALGLAPGDRTTLSDTVSGSRVKVLITGVFRRCCRPATTGRLTRWARRRCTSSAAWRRRVRWSPARPALGTDSRSGQRPG